MENNKRANGTGSAVRLKNKLRKQWVARICIGKDKNDSCIYYDIDSFETELQALVCLENYHLNPSSLYIKEDKYNKITYFPPKPYSLIPVKNPKKQAQDKVIKNNYTFKQLFEEFRKIKMLTKEEEQLEKKHHIRPQNKPFGRHYCRSMITAYHTCENLYDKVYKELRTSDFMNHLKDSGKKNEPQRQIINLFNQLDKYALQEDIIDKGYSQFITTTTTNRKEIKNSQTVIPQKDKIFTYEQIAYLWDFKSKLKEEARYNRKDKEIFIRDFWLMLLYTGTRADELLSVYTNNVFLNHNYFIGGLKTEAGINREIPIHPDIKPIFEKYYNFDSEFLFIQPNRNKIDYDFYLYHYKYNFKEFHPFVANHTAHDARHTLRTELEKNNIKQIIINSIIGHSNDDIGKDVYSHVSIEEKLEAIKFITYKKLNNTIVLAS
jgi:integrase